MKVADQLAQLAAAGLRPAPGVDEQVLAWREPPPACEEPPFRRLLEVLGGTSDREPFSPFCERLWLFDTNRIHGAGAYAAVLARLERMTGGALGISDVTDGVDRWARRAWVVGPCRRRCIHPCRR